MISRNINDYGNVIYYFQKIDKNRFLVSLDYQQFYVPEHSEIGPVEEKEFAEVFTNALNYLDNEYYKIINTDGKKT